MINLLELAGMQTAHSSTHAIVLPLVDEGLALSKCSLDDNDHDDDDGDLFHLFMLIFLKYISVTRTVHPST